MAGSTYDIGTVPGTPPVGEVNWIAWLDKNVGLGGYPSEIISEDNTNSGTAIDQGYQNFGGEPNPNWILQVENFSNENNGDSVSIILGGLEASTGFVWQDSFVWDQNDSSPTDQGEASEIVTNKPCPSMTQGLWDGSQKIINWTGSVGTYHIYRSTQPSGAGNNASNGRFEYIDTVTTTSTTGSYIDNINIASWHIVIPAEENGIINGCHSEESNPNAIEVKSIDIGANSVIKKLVLITGITLILALIFILFRKRKFTN